MPNQNLKRYIAFIFAASFILESNNILAQKHHADSVKVAAYSKYDKVSPVHRLLFGENYRKLWAMPVKMKVFHLSKEQGGLTITELGGGKQTKTLHLEDASGHKWALRTVRKFPGRQLSKDAQHTIVEDIVVDEVTTSHPYAALVVPPLADALNIPHSHPQIVFVPDDPALGKYRKDFANQVCLFEEREPLDGTKVHKTEKIQDKVEEDNDNLIDQKMVLRARLLDMVIGDWDRHEDQWKWEKEKGDENEKVDVYEPVPTDRDKVFYTTSGIFPWFLSHQFLKSQLQPYRKDIKDVKGWNYNARYFDHYFLTGLDEKEWKKQIAIVQSRLTDRVLTEAVKRLPPNIYKASGPKLVKTLIGRRDNLNDYALEYYRFLAKDVNIPATAKNEEFLIDQKSDGRVTVTIRKVKKDDSLGHKVYERTFDPKDTKEVRLYGLGGSDDYMVRGKSASPIKVRMIGGNGKDSYAFSPDLRKTSNLYIYDHPDSGNVLPTNGGHIHLSGDTLVNNFNRQSFKYDKSSPILTLGYSTEDGIRLIAGYQIEKQGFGKESYAWRQELLAGYTVSRNAWLFNYWGDFKKAVGDNDLFISIVSRGPNNQSNFFGLGNQPVFVNSGYQRFDYYRDRYDLVNADIRLYHTFNNLQLSGGVLGQYYNSYAAANTNKFLNAYNQQHPEEHVFSTKTFSGLVAGTSLDTRDNNKFPTNGVLWNTTVDGMTGLNVSNNTFGQIHSEFSFYISPGQDSAFVIADRIAGGYMIGHASYFQYFGLGGPQSMQGFHTNRFVGDAIAYNNFELRWKVAKLHWYLLPSTIGLVAFDDFGRVWLKGESSNQWHDTYGGGLFLMPGKVTLMAVVGVSKETVLPYLSLGFRF